MINNKTEAYEKKANFLGTLKVVFVKISLREKLVSRNFLEIKVFLLRKIY